MFNRPPKSLQDLLAKGPLAELNKRSDDAEHLSALWQQAVSPELAAATRCIALREGVLSVAVATSAWATRLRFTEHHIIHNLQRIPDSRVNQLEIHIDPSLFQSTR
ncbi:MAG: DUF721 domain-containing protein [Idiomarina sp.]|nr:DUF721 domain-containing protein [Idiomarina sp.]